VLKISLVLAAISKRKRTMKQLLKKCQYGAVAALAIAMLLVMTGESGKAQQGDEQRKFLELRRRQIELQAARKQYERSEKLAAQGLVPQTDIDRDRITSPRRNSTINRRSWLYLSFNHASLSVQQPRHGLKTAVSSFVW
jgi:multidrug resistance efflux pump